MPPNLMDTKQKEELYRRVMGEFYSVAENTPITSTFNPRNRKPPPPYVPVKKQVKEEAKQKSLPEEEVVPVKSEK
jgi:hypothetical protein